MESCMFIHFVVSTFQETYWFLLDFAWQRILTYIDKNYNRHRLCP